MRNENRILPIIIRREGCWFFDQKCHLRKSETEINIEIHNELLTLGDYENWKSPFDSKYSLEPIHEVPS